MSRLPRTLELPQLLFSCTRSAQNVAIYWLEGAHRHGPPAPRLPLSEGGPPMPTNLDIVEARWAKSRAPDASGRRARRRGDRPRGVDSQRFIFFPVQAQGIQAPVLHS